MLINYNFCENYLWETSQKTENFDSDFSELLLQSARLL